MAKAGKDREETAVGSQMGGGELGTLYVRRVPRDLIGEIKRLAGRKEIPGIQSENDAIVWLLARSVRSLSAEQYVWACVDPKEGRDLADRDPDFLASEMVVNHYTDVAAGETGFVMRGHLWTMERKMIDARSLRGHALGRAYGVGDKAWISPDAGKTLWVVTQVWYTPSGTTVEARMDLKPAKGRLDARPRPWIGQSKGGLVEDGAYRSWGREASENVRKKSRKEA